MRTNALLDCEADSTLVREDIAKVLQRKGEQKPLKIQNALWDSGQIESNEVSKFYNFVKPSPAENTNHQSMVNTKLVNSTH